MEIVDEENKIFSMFNELNSDDDFDILCDNIAPTGSHIRQRVCEPRFVKRNASSNGSRLYARDWCAKRV